MQEHKKEIITEIQTDIVIVLVGLMGAGKTFIGRKLAAKLGIPFFDADVEIETAAGCSINEIFAQYGEKEFRTGERRVIKRLLTEKPAVIATGGGSFIDNETRCLISKQGVSIWLKAQHKTLLKRTKGRHHRPLLNQGNPTEVLDNLIKSRYPVYKKADITIESDTYNANATIQKIIKCIINYKNLPINNV
jgi:shikimate kinase